MHFFYDGYGSGAGAAAATAIVYLIFLLVYVGIALIGYVVSSLFYMRIFDKAGVQGRWRAWVPFYNVMVLFKLGDISPWFVFIVFGGVIPVLNFFVGIAFAVLLAMAAWRIGQKLQKEGAWVVLAVLLYLVWLGINAFDKSRWNLSIPPAPWANSFLRDTTVWAGIPAQVPAGGYAYNPAAGPQGYPQQPPVGYPTQPPAGYPTQPPAGYPTQPPAYPTQPPAGYPTQPPAAQPPAYPTQPPAPPSNQPPAPPQA